MGDTFSYIAKPAPPQNEKFSEFTRAVMAMEVSTARALVYERAKSMTAMAVCARCAGAIRVARKHDRSKEFVFRVVHVRGMETFAIWRIK